MAYNPNNPNGQATSANSAPVVIASNQPTLPVSNASLPLPAGASTSALQTTGNISLSSIDSKTPALGQATMAVSVPVVIASNQSTIPVSVAATTPPSNLLSTGTLTGTGQTVSLTLQGTASVNVDVSGPGFVGTITVSENTPSSARTLGVFALNASAIASSITTNGNYRIVGIPTSGTIQVQFSAYTSGSATINIYGSTAPYIVQPYSANAANVLVTSYLNDASGNALNSTSNALNVYLTNALPAGANVIGAVVGNVAAGSADSGNGVKVSGVYNTTVPSLSAGNRGDIQLDVRGAQQMTPLDGCRQTYSAASTLPLAASATDVFTLTGSASKTIRITLIRLSGLATTAITVPVQLIKRASVNTGGTISTNTAVPHDSTNATATATCVSYTANPATLGTTVGALRADKVNFGLTASDTSPIIVWDFGIRPSQALVLRGATEVIAISMATITVTGGSLSVDIEWTEE